MEIVVLNIKHVMYFACKIFAFLTFAYGALTYVILRVKEKEGGGGWIGNHTVSHSLNI